MVLRKKRVHVDPPAKFKYEKDTVNYTEYTARGYGDLAPVLDGVDPRPQLYPISWGWNASGRTGNATATEVRSPSLVQKSKGNLFVAGAAAHHHSLLVTDDGNVFSFGDGRKGQLGYGNTVIPVDKDYVQKPHEKNVRQCYPRQVTPSGELKFGKDIRVSQVGGGLHFSIARELSVEEGIDLIEGLRALENRFSVLYSYYLDTVEMQRVWAQIRQERFVVSRTAGGNVVVWGTGKCGELGLGIYVDSTPSPTVIEPLRKMSITSLAVGNKHVLAINSLGALYSWGCGKGGRLGQRDFDNRMNPTKVKFFDTFFVEQCAAGDAHSCVLTSNRKGLPRHMQTKRVMCFGRGAHGRLGNGKNKAHHTPVIVSKWPASLDGMQYKQISCGGAHTLVLASMSVTTTLANPLGLVTRIYGWGYGVNGQLGTGYLQHSFIPLKSRMPNEIAAGRSWSLARTISGDLYTWGKGLRGQVGLGRQSYCVSPVKIPDIMPVLKLSANISHTVGIAVARKHLNEKIVLEKAKNVEKADLLTYPFVSSSLKVKEGRCAYTFCCCRRTSVFHQNIRFMCKECNLSSICYSCAKTCHSKHTLTVRNFANGQRYVDRAHENDVLQQEAWKIVTKPTEYVTYMGLGIDNNLQAKRSAIKSHGNSRQTARHFTEKLLKAKPYEKKKKEESNKGSEKKHIRWFPFAYTFYKEHPYVPPDGGNPPEHHHHRHHRHHGHHHDHQSHHRHHSHHGHGDHHSHGHQARDSREQQPHAQTTPAAAPKVYPLIPFCQCGVFNLHCKVLPTIKEVDERRFARRGRTPVTREALCARLIQRYVRRFFAYRAWKQRQRDIAFTRRKYCRDFWQKEVVDRIYEKIYDVYRSYREQRERQEMDIELDLRKKYDFNFNLQTALAGMDALMYGIKKLLGQSSNYIPRIYGGAFPMTNKFSSFGSKKQLLSAMRVDEVPGMEFDDFAGPVEGGEGDMFSLASSVETESLGSIYDSVTSLPQMPTFTFTWASLREKQLMLPPSLRLRVEDVALIARFAPKFDSREGKIYDPDINLFIGRFVHDAVTERKRNALAKKMAAAAAAKQAKVDAALAALKAKKTDVKALFAQAAAIVNPPPPRGPPPPSALRAFRKKKQEEAAAKKAEEYRQLAHDEDDNLAPFDQFKKGTKPVRLLRRQSIGAPEDMYSRIRDISTATRMHNYAHRRNSLPNNVSELIPTQRSDLQHVDDIRTLSLSMFSERKLLMEEFIDEKYNSLWENFSPFQKRQRLRKVLNYSWMTPLPPREVVSLITEAQRRRTVGEPERLAQQLECILTSRTAFGRLRGRLRRVEKMPIRRRSFDLNEDKDEKLGITEAFGVEYEETMKTPTSFGFKKDSKKIDQMFDKFKWCMQHREDVEDVRAKENYLSETYEMEVLDKDIDRENDTPLTKAEIMALQMEAAYAQENVNAAATTTQTSEFAGTNSFAEDSSLVAHWQEHSSDDGTVYYFNEFTGESVWEYPMAPTSNPSQDVQILSQYQDEDSGDWYWYNNTTGDTSWM